MHCFHFEIIHGADSRWLTSVCPYVCFQVMTSSESLTTAIMITPADTNTIVPQSLLICKRATVIIKEVFQLLLERKQTTVCTSSDTDRSEWVVYKSISYPHRNGFSPVCVRMCFLRSLSVVKYLVHPSDSQLNVLPVCSLWCAFSLTRATQ